MHGHRHLTRDGLEPKSLVERIGHDLAGIAHEKSLRRGLPTPRAATGA
jgi:hypothetical protein